MHLGVCYYPEHWPEEMWAQDATDMARLGISHVRIGEFAWSRIEPRAGEFDWDWLDRAIETLHGAGLRIILGTPTATPPKWLMDAHPEIMPNTRRGNLRGFGSRRHYRFSSPIYREHSRRITRELVERYGTHPGVAMWQTDNEYGCHDTVESNDPDARAAFQLWLKDRYGSTDALNTAWGTVFWSQEYTSFDQVEPPLATVTEAHPAHRVDWRRFCSDQVRSFNAEQLGELEKTETPIPVTHNFMGHFTEFDHWSIGSDLAIATWDSYPLGFLEQAWWPSEMKVSYARNGHPDFAGFHHDLYRGVGNGRFGIMEQQPGPVNWANYNPAPQSGMVRLWSLEAFAHGAELMSYFRWRQAPFAQEQMHAGVRRPDNQPAPAEAEIEAVVKDLETLGDLPPADPSKIALVFDYEAQWICQIQPQSRDFNYEELCYTFYEALRRFGLSIDIVGPTSDLSGYTHLVFPSQPILSDEIVACLKNENTKLLFGPRSGSRTETFQIPSNLAPGALQAHLPIKVFRSDSLRPGLTSSGNVDGETFEVSRWRDEIETDLSADIELDTGEGIYWSHHGVGYLAAWPDMTLLKAVLSRFLSDEVKGRPWLPHGLRLRQRGDLVFAINYGEAVDLIALGLTSTSTEFVIGAAALNRADVAVWKS